MEHLRVIPVFLRCAEASSFSAVARDLGLTPQAVSRQMAQLEAWAGVPLFQKTTRRVALTEEGEAFRARCKQGVDAIEEGVRQLRASKDEPAGTVRLAAPHGICHFFLVSLLPRFLAQYPQVAVDLLVQNEMPDVVKQRIDLGIIGGKLRESSLVARRITSFRYQLAAAPAYLARHGTPRRMEDLRKHRCVDLRNPRTGKIFPWLFERGQEVVTMDIRSVFTANDSEVQRQAVLNGAGIGQVASFFLAAHARDGTLRPIKLGYVAEPLDLHLYMPREAQKPRRTKVLADFLVQEMRSHPDLESGIKDI